MPLMMRSLCFCRGGGNAVAPSLYGLEFEAYGRLALEIRPMRLKCLGSSSNSAKTGNKWLKVPEY